jgi:hypothetical protein
MGHLAQTVFIVGAGFSLAANRQCVRDGARHGHRYPLVGDLAATCFGEDILPDEVERAFASSIQRGLERPVDLLVHAIQAADYYVGSLEAQAQDSPYHRLLDTFPDSQFVSFNYDALLELLLIKRGAWRPSDGFGVRAEVGTGGSGSASLAPSRTLVLHLHGTTLLYAVEMDYQTQTRDQRSMTWMTPRRAPRFLFDPDALGYCFPHFARAEPEFGYRSPKQRIIAPVPNKKPALSAPFVAAVSARAVELIRSAARIIAVGYRFASCDRQSFDTLVTAAAEANVEIQIVSPDAADVARYLQSVRPDLRLSPTTATFEEWTRGGFLK